MLQLLREEAEGKRQMLLLPRKNGLTSLFKVVRVFKVRAVGHFLFFGQFFPFLAFGPFSILYQAA